MASSSSVFLSMTTTQRLSLSCFTLLLSWGKYSSFVLSVLPSGVFPAGFCGADCPARVVEGLDFSAAVRLFCAAFACGFFVEVVFFRIINDICSRHRYRRQGLCAAPDRRLCLSRRNRCGCAVHKDEHQTAHQE